MDDLALLRQFVEEHSDAAFAKIVEQHIDMVYSSALRQLADRHVAEDVTQTVFLVLAKKSRRVCDSGRPLSAWLLTATRFTALDARKVARRREYREQEAARMANASEQSSRERDSTEADWEKLSPILDNALGRLRDTLRTAVVLRFFENQSYSEVARRLDITEVAARQRVSRGVDQLREILSRRGVVLHALGLETMLLAHVVHAAPAGLSTGTMTIATKGAALSAHQITLTKGIIMATTPVAVKAAGIAVVVGILVAGGVAVKKLAMPSRAVDVSLTAAPVSAIPAAPGAMPGIPIKGKVQTADGKPLALADVWLSRKSGKYPVIVVGRQTLPISVGLHVKSTADGSFEFPGIDDAVSVVVLADEGTAILPVADVMQNGVVRVEPWATISGTVTAKGKPVAEAVVTLEHPDQGQAHDKKRVGFQPRANGQKMPPTDYAVRLTARTDGNGHFAFPNVTAGDINLWMSVKNSAPGTSERRLLMKAAAGEHITADMGSGGRNVKGKIVIKQGLPPYEGSLDSLPSSQRPSTWIHFAVEPDGTFEAEGVPAGKYELDIGSWENNPKSRSRECFASYRGEVMVGPADGGQVATAIDVGTIKPDLRATLNIGQAVPDFPFKMVDDGTEKRLSSFQGKYLLLHFVYLTAKNSVNDVHTIETLRKRIGDDPRITILEVASDIPADIATKYRDTNHISWNLAIGKLGELTLADRQEGAPLRGPDFIPPVYIKTAYMLFLIDPQGKLLAKNLDEKSALEAIDRALGAHR